MFAGVHFRSDHDYGARLGELVTIRVLQDNMRTYHETAARYEFETFANVNIRVTPDGPALSNTIS